MTNMAVRTQITKDGASLLASSSAADGQFWWIGWYALAYVPPEMKDEDGEALTSTMTKLTTKGDMIYNIFQGDMNGEGYVKQSANSNFGIVNYDSNIKKNYRYVIDSTGRNNLVTWIDSDSGMKGAYVYKGVDVSVSDRDNSTSITNSAIPVPAPLFYAGESVSLNGFTEDPGMESFMATHPEKYFSTIQTKVGGTSDVEIPMISTDFRKYNVYRSGINTPGKYAGDYNGNLPCTKIVGSESMDAEGWFGSDETYTQGDDASIANDYNAYCKEYWKALSISNFNKYCAPVNSIGLAYDEDAGCRNMAKTTKYFPVYSYNVINTKEYGTNEYATGIKLGIKLNITTKVNSDETYCDASMSDDGSGNIEYLNKSFSSVKDSAGNQIFSSNSISFKFNRMGIYAVPMRQYGCSGDNVTNAQYQIDTEVEPVLFAVCDWDSANTLSDSGDGLSTFETDVCIDLTTAADDSAVIRDTALFYNLYEDDSIDWYKNQLLANAAMSEAITNMQIEIGYLKEQLKKKESECCNSSIDLSQFALKSHSHKMLKNLVDSNTYSENGVRNIDALSEGTAEVSLPGKGSVGGAYKIGHNSYSFGDGSMTAGDYSFNMGVNSAVDSASSYVSLMSDYNSIIKRSHQIMLANSAKNYIDKSGYVFVENGSENDVRDNGNIMMHIHGSNNMVQGNSLGESTEINGNNNWIMNAGRNSGAHINGNSNEIFSSAYVMSSTINGDKNHIYSSSYVMSSTVNMNNMIMSESSYVKSSILNGCASISGGSNVNTSALFGDGIVIKENSYVKNSTLCGQNINLNDGFSGENVHIYGNAPGLNGELKNVIMFGADEGTKVGNVSESQYSESYMLWCLNNHRNYPTVFSEGGMGLYGRRLTLGNLDGNDAKPQVGDSLVVERVDGDTAVVNWGKNVATSSLELSHCALTDTLYTSDKPGEEAFRPDSKKEYRVFPLQQNFDSAHNGIATYLANIRGRIWCEDENGDNYPNIYPQMDGVLYITCDNGNERYVAGMGRFTIQPAFEYVTQTDFNITVSIPVDYSEADVGNEISEYIELRIKDVDYTSYVFRYAIFGNEKGDLTKGASALSIFKQYTTESTTSSSST